VDNVLSTDGASEWGNQLVNTRMLLGTFKNLPISPIFDPSKLRKCVYAVGGSTAQKNIHPYICLKGWSIGVFWTIGQVTVTQR
jgi:hypothetical protein